MAENPCVATGGGSSDPSKPIWPGQLTAKQGIGSVPMSNNTQGIKGMSMYSLPVPTEVMTFKPMPVPPPTTKLTDGNVS